jgi:hypothetical protein
LSGRKSDGGEKASKRRYRGGRQGSWCNVWAAVSGRHRPVRDSSQYGGGHLLPVLEKACAVSWTMVEVKIASGDQASSTKIALIGMHRAVEYRQQAVKKFEKD